MTREEVVQAALTVKRWCEERQDEFGNCDCPFKLDCGNGLGLCKIGHDRPSGWYSKHFFGQGG